MQQSITAAALSGSIRAKALEIGFDLVGVADVQSLETEVAHFSEWLALGYQATMQWMERNTDKRSDPRWILPDAQSVISVALNYDSPHRHDVPETFNDQELSNASGKISRYAWGDDYHTVIPPMLEQLSNYIIELVPQAKNKIYVDTGPLLEKQWAVRAGIGWQGKHSNVISREIGSFFFLAEIITSVQLEPSKQIDDYCGQCTACIDACPTKAIVEPYVVDSRKCLSYWTIESKDAERFPNDIRDHTEGWMYGCDICQDVCPWNRFRRNSELKEFLPRKGQTELAIDEVNSMSAEEFSQRFRNSPIKRTKISGLQRNARMLSEYYNKCNTAAKKNQD